MKRKIIGFVCFMIYLVGVSLTFGVCSGLTTTIVTLANVGIEISTLMLYRNMLFVIGLIEIILSIIFAISIYCKSFKTK